MRRHLTDDHQDGSPDDFSSRVLRTHLSALGRQIYEAWAIKSHNKGLLLNSNYEYNHGIIPTLSANFTSQPLRADKDNVRADRIAEELSYLDIWKIDTQIDSPIIYRCPKKWTLK